MLPGPQYVYKCPSCGNLLQQESLMSGNTFGTHLYSDGKQEAPMLPEFPEITRCKKCDSIFWLVRLEEIGTYYPGYHDHPGQAEWEAADTAEFLSIGDYFRALDEGLAENQSEELYLRQRIWWAYNDRVREMNGEIFRSEQDEALWKENLLRMLELLNDSDPGRRVMKAEIHRNLGEYETCVQILQALDDPELNRVKEQMLRECAQQNRWVVELK